MESHERGQTYWRRSWRALVSRLSAWFAGDTGKPVLREPLGREGLAAGACPHVSAQPLVNAPPGFTKGDRVLQLRLARIETQADVQPLFLALCEALNREPARVELVIESRPRRL